MSRVSSGVFAVALALLCGTSCDRESTTAPKREEPRKATIVGTLSLPEAVPGKTFAVVVDNDTTSANGFVRVATGLCGSAREVPYRIEDVPAGTYFLYAVVWVVSPPLTSPRSGDFVGFYGTSGTFPPEPNARVPASGEVVLNIVLIRYP